MELVKQGIIWRIGNGSKVQIWRDPWIPRAPSLKVSLRKGRSRLRWVAQLLQEGRKEWDGDKFQTCMFDHDIEEIRRIRLSDTVSEDVIAWHYEKSGIFTVRSAYWLAVKIDQQEQHQMGQSRSADGNRSLFSKIWSAPVPQKVRVFAWKLSQEGLATQLNRKHRTLTRQGTCTICGMEDETGHHAVVRCTKSRALRQELRKSWLLPDEEQFEYTGPDWLMLLLASVNKEVGVKILMLLWRSWHLRNDIIYGEGKGSIVGSARFLISYLTSLQGVATPLAKTEDLKGKGKMFQEGCNPVKAPAIKQKWDPPPSDW